jgi:YD repeat-containing protein
VVGLESESEMRVSAGFRHDPAGRQTAQVAAEGLVYYEYDARGRRVALKDQRGYASYFAYDALSRLVSELDPLGNAEYYAYDAGSNLLSRTAADGLSVYYAHDTVNRLVSTLYPDGAYTYFTVRSWPEPDRRARRSWMELLRVRRRLAPDR